MFQRLTLLSMLVITLCAVGVAFAGPQLVTATDYGLGQAEQTGLPKGDLATTVINIIRWALGLLGLVAVILMVYGGFTWLTAAGNEKKIETAKSIIQGAIIGLVIIILAFSIASFVINNIDTAAQGTP